MIRLTGLVLCCFLVLVDHSSAQTPESDRLAADLRTLQANGVDTDTISLTEMLRHPVMPAETRARIAGLIAKLGADDFDMRERAAAILKRSGIPARLPLRAATHSPDAEVRARALALLESLPPPWAEEALLPTAARVLVRRNAPGLAELLLDCLPYIESADCIDSLASTLDDVAFVRDREPDLTLLRALKDEEPVRRWAAACALVRRAGDDHRKAVYALLEDDNEAVRLRVGAVLVRARDRAGLLALVRLVASKAADVSGEAEDLLARIAGDKGPVWMEAGVPAEKRRGAWEAWYRATGADIDLAKIDFETPAARTLVGAFRFWNREPGILVELDTNGRILWTITAVERPIYARKVGPDRVLICEFMPNQVTERDTKGRVLQTWKLDATPYNVERLPSGNTFIATRNTLVEYSPTGKEVSRVHRPADDIVAATLNEDGTFTVVTRGETCVRLDRLGKEIASFPIGKVVRHDSFKAHFLPNGGVVIPEEFADRIREYDRTGKVLAEVRVPGPRAVTRLANGNYLYTRDRRMELIVVTPEGRRVLVRPVPLSNNGEGQHILFAEPR